MVSNKVWIVLLDLKTLTSVFNMAVNTVKRLFRNIFYLSVSEIAWRILSFIVVIYLARIFPVSGFGKIAFSQTVVTIYFLIITDFGLRTLGTHIIARDKKRIGKLFSNVIAMRLILAFFHSFCCACLLFLLTRMKPQKSFLFSMD